MLQVKIVELWKFHFFLTLARKQYIQLLATNTKMSISERDREISKKCEEILISETTLETMKGSIGKQSFFVHLFTFTEQGDKNTPSLSFTVVTFEWEQISNISCNISTSFVYPHWTRGKIPPVLHFPKLLLNCLYFHRIFVSEVAEIHCWHDERTTMYGWLWIFRLTFGSENIWGYWFLCLVDFLCFPLFLYCYTLRNFLSDFSYNFWKDFSSSSFWCHLKC